MMGKEEKHEKKTLIKSHEQPWVAVIDNATFDIILVNGMLSLLT